MKVSEALVKRRAIKAYDPAFVIPKEDIRRLFELTLLTPSSYNLQHWRFAAVVDRAIKLRLYEAAWKQPHIRDASLDVVLAGNLDAAEEAGRYWRNAPADVQEKLVPRIEALYQNEELKRDETIRSVSLAAMSFMLAATEMGYDTCPMIGFDPDKVAGILKMPDNWIPVMLITVGKGIKKASPKPGQLAVKEVAFWNSFEGEPIE